MMNNYQSIQSLSKISYHNFKEKRRENLNGDQVLRAMGKTYFGVWVFRVLE